MTDPVNLHNAAGEIFETALVSVDANAAVRRAVQLHGSCLTVADTSIDLASDRSGIYVIAAGKAAPAMATALSEVLGNKITAGIISGPAIQQHQSDLVRSVAPGRWQSFAGGHPLPNQQSLNAAQASVDLVKRAHREHALVLFLISGGGSAMLEWPIEAKITLDDLQKANRILVSCGASITEINSVRRAFSAVKGGRLAAQAPNAAQISLIISDTNSGDEASVASGPSIEPPPDSPDPRAVVANYQTLAGKLPPSILKAINNPEARAQARRTDDLPRNHYVLLDNRTALAAAAAAARRHGFLTEVAFDVVEANIAEGCQMLLSRLEALRSRAAGTQQAVCLISGGEFLCPVRGDGIGGRNAETVLRCAIEIDKPERQLTAEQIVVLSAGTDGIDGNSPAAGAVADMTTLGRARSLGLDAHGFLAASDAFSFFDKLGDAVSTGATGTNVRDVRIMLAR